MIVLYFNEFFNISELIGILNFLKRRNDYFSTILLLVYTEIQNCKSGKMDFRKQKYHTVFFKKNYFMALNIFNPRSFYF